MIRLPIPSLSARDRRALLLGCVIVGPVLMYMLVVKPYMAAVANLQEQVDAQRALLVRELEILARGPSFPHDVEDAARRLDRAEARLVRSADQPAAESELTRYLEELARGSRVLLQELRGVALGRMVTPPRGTHVIRMAISGESDLNGIAKFVQGIETGPLFLDIAELTIEPKPEERSGRREAAPSSQEGVLQFRMTVQAFAPAPSQEIVQ